MLKKLPKDYYLLDSNDLSTHSNSTLLEYLLELDTDIGNACGGMASCGTCRVILDESSSALPPNGAEQNLRSERQFNSNERLACQLTLKGKLVFKIPNSENDVQ